MIKFAVTRPKERLESIRHGVGMLKWHEDIYLDHFGLKIDPNMTKVGQPPTSEALAANSTEDYCSCSSKSGSPVCWCKAQSRY
jgi:Argonaute linker 2 domain